MAGESGAFGRVFGAGSTFAQLLEWTVLAQVIGAIGAPGLEALTQLVNSHAPITPLSVADAVDAALKGHVSEQAAEAEARLSGYSAERFRILLAAAGEPPGPSDLAVAARRGLIPWEGTGAESVSFEQGIREGRTNNKWTATIRGLAVQQPSPVDILDALLEGQIDHDPALALYQRLGGDPEFFELLFNTRGSAPTPLEAADMANRGIIPWDGHGPDVVSFEQAFLEGPWRDKWQQPYRQAAEYRPPVRTIVAMLRNGSITDQTALRWFKDVGMTEETAAAMLIDAHHQKVQTTKDLAKGDVLALYKDQIIDAAKATAMLRGLDYSEEEAGFELARVDFERESERTRAFIARIHTQYVARHIDREQTVNALGAFHVSAAQQQALLEQWDIERGSSPKTLTAAQVTHAFHLGLIDQFTAQAELEEMGYSPIRAWILLSEREGKALPNRPGGVLGVGGK